MGYYNIIYGLTKAVFLESIVETKDYISEMIAQEIIRRNVSEAEFPDLNKVALKKL